jgi:hypothetical protein
VLGLLAVLSCSVSPRLFEIEPGTTLSTIWGGELVAQIDGRRMRYQIPTPALGYVRTGIFRAEIRLQVDRDGRAFVLAGGDKPPIDGGSYAQPPGFPVSPLAP